MSAAFRLPRRDRIRRAAEFRRAYRGGRRARSERLTVLASRSDAGRTRIGLSVSSRVGNAAVRNRWKRLLREAFRLERARLPDGFDLVFIPEGTGTAPPLVELREALPRLAADAVRALERSPRRDGPDRGRRPPDRRRELTGLRGGPKRSGPDGDERRPSKENSNGAGPPGPPSS